MYGSSDELAELNKEINELKAENKRLSQQVNNLTTLIQVFKQYMIDNDCACYDSKTGEFKLKEAIANIPIRETYRNNQTHNHPNDPAPAWWGEAHNR